MDTSQISNGSNPQEKDTEVTKRRGRAERKGKGKPGDGGDLYQELEERLMQGLDEDLDEDQE